MSLRWRNLSALGRLAHLILNSRQSERVQSLCTPHLYQLRMDSRRICLPLVVIQAIMERHTPKGPILPLQETKCLLRVWGQIYLPTTPNLLSLLSRPCSTFQSNPKLQHPHHPLQRLGPTINARLSFCVVLDQQTSSLHLLPPKDCRHSLGKARFSLLKSPRVHPPNSGNTLAQIRQSRTLPR